MMRANRIFVGPADKVLPGVGNTKPRAQQRGTKNAERSKKGKRQEPRKDKQKEEKQKEKAKRKIDVKIWNIWYIICTEKLAFSF
jgi:hypothetical protein